MLRGNAGNDVILSVDAVTKPAEDGLDRVKRKLREVTEETKKADRAAKDHQQTLGKTIQAGGKTVGGVGGRAASVITSGLQADGVVGKLAIAGAAVGVAFTAFEHIMNLQEQHIRKQVEWENKLADARKSAVDAAKSAAGSQATGMAGGWRKMLREGGKGAEGVFDDLMKTGLFDESSAMQVAGTVGKQAGGKGMAEVIKSAAAIGLDPVKVAEQLVKNPGIMKQGDEFSQVAMASSLAGTRMSREDVASAMSASANSGLLASTSSAASFDAETNRKLRGNVSRDPGILLDAAAKRRSAMLTPEAFAEGQAFQAMQKQNEILERLAANEGIITQFLMDFTKSGSFKTQLSRERGAQGDAVFVATPAAVSPASPR